MLGESIGVVLCSGVFVAVGLGFAAIGRYLLGSARRLAKVGVRVPGEVVGMRVNQSSDVGRGSYYPVLQFRTADQQVVETSSDIGTDPPMAQEGDRVTVIYDPADPRVARIDSALGSGTGIGWACLIGGCVLTVIATLLGVAGVM